MRIRLDTELKTITVEKTTNFGTFMKKIEAILPNGEWKEYDLNVELLGNWNDVIYVDRSRWMDRQPNNPWQPWNRTITYSAGPPYNTTTYGGDPGDEHIITQYNIEI